MSTQTAASHFVTSAVPQDCRMGKHVLQAVDTLDRFPDSVATELVAQGHQVLRTPDGKLLHRYRWLGPIWKEEVLTLGYWKDRPGSGSKLYLLRKVSSFRFSIREPTKWLTSRTIHL